MLLGQLPALMACLVAGSGATSERTQKVVDILESVPCAEHAVRVTAYLEASRHGSWLVDKIGATNGIRLDFDPQSKRKTATTIKNYAWNPREYLNKTFHATFYGKLKCPLSGENVIALNVERIEDVDISHIKEAKSH